MFFGSIEFNEDIIRIIDIQPDIFEDFLKFVYVKKIELTSLELAYDLWYCGNKYMVPQLVDKCVNYFFSAVTCDSVCKIYEFSKFMQQENLKKTCVTFIKRFISSIMLSPSWTLMNPDTVIDILDISELHCLSELILFRGLEKWIRSECERKGISISNSKLVMKDFINLALSKIRFLAMSPEEFTSGPAKSFLLEERDAVSLLANILTTDTKVTVPSNFSNNKENRIRSIFKIKTEILSPMELSLIQREQERRSKIFQGLLCKWNERSSSH